MGQVRADLLDPYRKTSIKRRVSNKRWGFEACVLINAWSRLNAGSQINARVF